MSSAIHTDESQRSTPYRVAAITMCRGDLFFLERWIAYYGTILGREHLYIFIDGEDQPLPRNGHGTHIEVKQHIPLSRSAGDKHRITLINERATALFSQGYDAVIGTDCDEFLAVDPYLGLTLPDFLQRYAARGYASLSALGIDVGQNLHTEKPLDRSKPILAQRRYGVLSSRYTKASVRFSPTARWGSGFHRIKGHNYHIAAGLYLFHTGYCCESLLGVRLSDATRIAGGWENHLGRRGRTIRYATQLKPLRGDPTLRRARCLQQTFRQPQAINKPLMPTGPRLIEIPERFRSLPF